MSATDPSLSSTNVIRNLRRGRDEARRERDEAIAEIAALCEAGKQLDGVIVRLSDENTALREERDAATREVERLTRYKLAAEEIALHHAMPAGESWEAAYNEVCTMALEALGEAPEPKAGGETES